MYRYFSIDLGDNATVMNIWCLQLGISCTESKLGVYIPYHRMAMLGLMLRTQVHVIGRR